MTTPYPDATAPNGPEDPHPAAAAEARMPRRAVFSSFFAAILVAVIIAATGVFVGWIWAAVAPRVAVIRTDSGFIYADPEPEQAIAADGWFAIIGLVVGVVFAILAWVLLRRHRGVAVLIGLAIGSLVGASLASWVGYRIGFSQFQAVRDSVPVGTRVDGPLGLRMTHLDRNAWWPARATGVAAVQALAAAFVYTTLAGFSSYASLRGPDRRAYAELDESQFGPGFTGRSDSAAGTART